MIVVLIHPGLGLFGTYQQITTTEGVFHFELLSVFLHYIHSHYLTWFLNLLIFSGSKIDKLCLGEVK